MTARKELLVKIMSLEFCLVELNLFLDTHPTDQKALADYHRINNELGECRDKYITLYGPLTVMDVESKDRWTWIDEPWPWKVTF